MSSETEENDFNLPRLNPLVRLYKSPDTAEGKPLWTLHDPLSNAYYQIGWAEFECLARFSTVKTGRELIETVNADTTLDIDIDDIRQLVDFLGQKGLLDMQSQPASKKGKAGSWWKKALHGYLFFSVPLVKPEAFLKRTLPAVEPFMSHGFLTAIAMVFVVASFLTLQRFDEFIHTFNGLISWEGLLLTLVVFSLVKVIHEMAHAYTAAKYGVPVPHMGVALIVLYPVLYTEVTGSLRLSSRKQRFNIGIAGVTAELCLAALFLMVWNLAPYGSAAQSISFSVVAISMVGSLLINLNPLMRFDGYYLLSDALGVDNLQSRACTFARWKLRQILFSFSDEPPESFTRERQNFLIWFGFALLIYRFFLFLGIAFLVYHVFFKPLGLILMVVELGWFIGLPVYSELKVWWQRKSDIMQTSRGKLTVSVFCVAVMLMIIPVPQTTTVPAVLHAKEYRALYPAASGQIKEIAVQEGQIVKKGETIARLQSADLENERKLAQQNLSNLLQQKRSVYAQLSYRGQGEISTLDEEIAAARTKIDGLNMRVDMLLVEAPFDGVVRDLAPDLYVGRHIKKTDLLMRIITPDKVSVSGYFSENDIDKLSKGQPAKFYPRDNAFGVIPVSMTVYETANVHELPWSILASEYGGPVPAEINEKDQKLVPLTSLYAAHFVPVDSIEMPSSVRAGYIRVDMPADSIILKGIKKLLSLWWNEGGLI